MTTQMPGEILAQNQCKCSHTSTLSFSFMLYNPAGPGGGGGAGGAGGGWEPRSRLERKAVPGKECSSRGGPGGERKGKVSLPGAKPATIFKPARPRFPTAHTRTHTHTHTHMLQIASRHHLEQPRAERCHGDGPQERRASRAPFTPGSGSKTACTGRRCS